MFLVLLIVSSATAQQSIYHDAWLNSDFWNKTGQTVNDFEIVVESPTFVPNQVLLNAPFPNYNVTVGDYSALHPGNETRIRWSGANVLADQIAHVGMSMNASGKILDAGWTWNGVRVPVVPGGPTSIAISYELTEIRPTNSGEIHMQLLISPQYFEDRGPSSEAGWTNIRTFRNLPASMLDLADLNRDLDLSTLTAWEVPPHRGVPGVPGMGAPILPADQILRHGIDSFFDVYLDTVGSAYLNAGYESLLHAEVLNQGVVIGEFWNLNPQSPEPGTWVMLVCGALASLIYVGWRRLRR